jgi:hypothetical protein
MTRVDALEKVAEAVRDYWLKSASHENFYAVGQALRALDALPAAPTQAQGEGETVEVAVWENEADGDIQFARIGGKMDDYRLQYRNWHRLGTTRLPIRATLAGKVTL